MKRGGGFTAVVPLRLDPAVPRLAPLVKYRTPLEEYRELRLALMAAAAAASFAPPRPSSEGSAVLSVGGAATVRT